MSIQLSVVYNKIRIIMEYRAKVYLITFFSYVGIHALRTTYSFSKGMIAETVVV
jgi:hypothetical protein